ncbi:heterokaryon incompatibility protein-domain-containing protein [Phaeosphaeriaceae sp. PMI808]|nr:heterokaryon incompatibility protein-domain-containing protein [Phaeosphaeriaceae sp. PMI808]
MATKAQTHSQLLSDIEDSLSTRTLHPTTPTEIELHEEEKHPQFYHIPLNLNTSSIRLIEVLPAGLEETVQCKIRHATVDDEYTCVSYVWGPPGDMHLIHVERRPFYVRRNLWEFLNMVSFQIAGSRSPDEAGNKLDVRKAATSLWIDALCIDQNSNEERNHQVQQMGRVFSGAQRVMSWIGERPRIGSFSAIYERADNISSTRTTIWNFANVAVMITGKELFF